MYQNSGKNYDFSKKKKKILERGKKSNWTYQDLEKQKMTRGDF